MTGCFERWRHVNVQSWAPVMLLKFLVTFPFSSALGADAAFRRLFSYGDFYESLRWIIPLQLDLRYLKRTHYTRVEASCRRGMIWWPFDGSRRSGVEGVDEGGQFVKELLLAYCGGLWGWLGVNGTSCDAVCACTLCVQKKQPREWRELRMRQELFQW